MSEAAEWIESLQLQPHPEGGWFREVYRSQESIPKRSLPNRFQGDRSFSTAIYYLLEKTDFSALHRIQQDELWHYYDGAALTVEVIDPDGSHWSVRLGKDFDAGQRPMAVVPAGCLFGAVVSDPEGFSLVGCTVAPGFDFADFELADRQQLLEQFPEHRSIIERLTRAG
jgi:predicted cupin superfamily sugar epimerase